MASEISANPSEHPLRGDARVNEPVQTVSACAFDSLVKDGSVVPVKVVLLPGAGQHSDTEDDDDLFIALQCEV